MPPQLTPDQAPASYSRVGAGLDIHPGPVDMLFLAERLTNKIKRFRRIFSRHDKLDRRYLSFWYFVSALIGLR